MAVIVEGIGLVAGMLLLAYGLLAGMRTAVEGPVPRKPDSTEACGPVSAFNVERLRGEYIGDLYMRPWQFEERLDELITHGNASMRQRKADIRIVQASADVLGLSSAAVLGPQTLSVYAEELRFAAVARVEGMGTEGERR